VENRITIFPVAPFLFLCPLLTGGQAEALGREIRSISDKIVRRSELQRASAIPPVLNG